MKFSEMPYKRPDPEELKAELQGWTQRLKAAKSYEEARAVFLEKQEKEKHPETMATLAYIRQSIDTRDAFYNEEKDFWDDFGPEIEEYEQEWKEAMLISPFRKDFEAEYSDLLFLNIEIARKTFSPVIIEDMQRENELVDAYDNLIASAQIPFEGGVYTLSQLEPFQDDPDDGRRLAAWKAKGQWYKDNQPQLDRIYDDLVRVRDAMGRKLGYDGYTQLGYYNMERNCWTKEDIEKFREAVQKYVVPLADSIMRAQAQRNGMPYPLSFADSSLMFRSGNPRPVGTPDDILAQGRKFYDELSPETSEFFRTMLEEELMDVLSTEGKMGGGYCNTLEYYERPFIFANFNGTQGDVEVVTHEAGHAFAYWLNRKRIPTQYADPTAEACEVQPGLAGGRGSIRACGGRGRAGQRDEYGDGLRGRVRAVHDPPARAVLARDEGDRDVGQGESVGGEDIAERRRVRGRRRAASGVHGHAAQRVVDFVEDAWLERTVRVRHNLHR